MKTPLEFLKESNPELLTELEEKGLVNQVTKNMDLYWKKCLTTEAYNYNVSGRASKAIVNVLLGKKK